jgi:hypothetical protein
MGAVANVTTRANTYTVNRVLSNIAAPEFAKNVVFVPLIYAEEMPNGRSTNVKGFRRQGTVNESSAVTSALAEANPQALQAPREDTVVDATAAKAVRVTGVSIENQKFSDQNLESYAQSSARAIARAVDNQGLALFSTVTNQVDVGGNLTIDALDDGQILILAGDVPNVSRNLTFMGGLKAMRSLKGEVRDSGGGAFTNPFMLSILQGLPQENGYYGTLPGYDLYYTSSGLTDVGGQDSQCLFHREWAFAGMFDPSISLWLDNKGSEGFYTELASYYFWAIVLWNPAAACEVLSTGL